MGTTIAGRARASTLMPLATPGAHVAQLHRSDDVLVATLAALAEDTLAAGDAVVCIVTAAHAAAVDERLRAEGLGAAVDDASADGRWVALDAERAVDRVIAHGRVVAQRFDDVVGTAIDRAAAASPRRMARAFGEMVATLAARERFDQALHLEEFWSDVLAEGRRFSLLCAYPMSLFEAATGRPRLVAVCGWHSHVGTAEADEWSDDLLATVGLAHASLPSDETFTVRCRWCGQILLLASRIAELETEAIVAHLRAVHPDAAAAFGGPALGAVLREVVVDRHR